MLVSRLIAAGVVANVLTGQKMNSARPKQAIATAPRRMETMSNDLNLLAYEGPWLATAAGQIQGRQ